MKLFKKSNKKILYIIIFIIFIISLFLLFRNESFESFDSNGTDESKCQLVSSRGIIKSCDIRSPNPVSNVETIDDYNWEDIREGCVIHICAPSIKVFIEKMKTINVKFILVSIDYDQTVWTDIFPDEETFREFIENPLIIRWHSQNTLGRHPKLFPIPIGLDYHSSQDKAGYEDINLPIDHDKMILSIRSSAKPWSQRIYKGYGSFLFTTPASKFHYDRVAAKEQIPSECVFYEPVRTERVEGYKRQTEYAFVVSPHGNGYDCHRTWEALSLGCIPIVRKSCLDPLYEGLPVLIVDEWSDVTKDLLQSTIQDFEKRTFDYDRLTLAYWMDLIRNGPK